MGTETIEKKVINMIKLEVNSFNNKQLCKNRPCGLDYSGKISYTYNRRRGVVKMTDKDSPG
ncbi:MAG: hypothetical protein KAI43_10340 [Candidatus Aureabacteria bacterium]|nr:hypothetical protein [Candidatus Auribacterota bacterium]